LVRHPSAIDRPGAEPAAVTTPDLSSEPSTQEQALPDSVINKASAARLLFQSFYSKAFIEKGKRETRTTKWD